MTTDILIIGSGGLVNEYNLAKILDEKNIYAGLDVTKNEPIEADNPLLSIKNTNRLLITPHIAWASKEARVNLVEGTVKNIEDFLRKQ